MSLSLVPIGLREAGRFVGVLHRHHGEPAGGKFAIGVAIDARLCGVAVAGRPSARRLDTGWIAEVTRLCTDGTPNACSILYGAAARAAKAMGYTKIVTYILENEPGDSLRASGWICEGPAGGGSWSRETRPRTDNAPTERKVRWSRHLRGEPQPIQSPDALLILALTL